MNQVMYMFLSFLEKPVSPLKSVTIPNLELTVLAVRVDKMVKSELQL